jgi:hypothetical protein
MARKITTIPVTPIIHSHLKSITRKGETFDRTVYFLIQLYNYICKINETNREEIEEILEENEKVSK